MNIIIPIAFVLIAAGLAFLAFKGIRQKKTVHVFQEIRKKPDIPYITIDIQGVKLNMIVDTGCGISIISENALSGLEHQPSARLISLSAMTSDSLESRVVSIPINVNGRTINEDFAIYDKGSDIAGFGAMYGIEMHGILGNEFLEKVKGKIDYEHHCITLY